MTKGWDALATERVREIRHLLSRRWWSPLRFAPSLGDAELRKALARIDAATGEAFALARRSGLGPDAQRDLARLLDFDPAQERLDATIERADQVERLLLECGDTRYVAMALQAEVGYEGGTAVGWSDLFGCDDGAPLLRSLMDGGPEGDSAAERARTRLLALRWTRSDQYRRQRARLRMKVRYLWMIALVLGALVVQPLLGAAAALFVLVVLESGMVLVGGQQDWAGRATVGFVAGFSEPFVLGVVHRVAALR